MLFRSDVLCEKYQVNGQTAWSLLKKAERFDIRIVTELDEAIAKKMRLNKMGIEALPFIADETGSSGYIFPDGAKFAIAGSESE